VNIKNEYDVALKNEDYEKALEIADKLISIYTHGIYFNIFIISIFIKYNN